MAMFFTHIYYIYNNSNKKTCSYIKKVLKKIYNFLIKLSPTTKQLIRRNSICCLKNQAIFSQSENRDRLNPSPPPVCFHLLFQDLPLPFHKQPFIKKGLLEQMEGVNDNVGAFMHLNIKANK